MKKEGRELLESIVLQELENYVEYWRNFRKKYPSDVKYTFSLEILEDSLDILIKTIKVKELARSLQVFDMTYLNLEIELSEKAESLKEKLFIMLENQENLKIANKNYIESLKNHNKKLKNYVKSLEDYIDLLKNNLDDRSGDY